jgi:hypothetical protein
MLGDAAERDEPGQTPNVPAYVEPGFSVHPGISSNGAIRVARPRVLSYGVRALRTSCRSERVSRISSLSSCRVV